MKIWIKNTQFAQIRGKLKFSFITIQYLAFQEYLSEPRRMCLPTAYPRSLVHLHIASTLWKLDNTSLTHVTRNVLKRWTSELVAFIFKFRIFRGIKFLRLSSGVFIFFYLPCHHVVVFISQCNVMLHNVICWFRMEIVIYF